MKFSPFKTILLFLVLLTVGIALLPLLPIKLQSTETLPSVTVSYSWNSATGRIIEQEVTTLLEGMFSRVRGVKNVTSTSLTGYGNITVDFSKETDFDAARFEISTLIRQAYPKFPAGVSYPSIYIQRQDNENIKPVLSYTLNAPASPVLIQKYAENHIKPLLVTLKGIQKIMIYGANPMEWIMEYNVKLINSQGISRGDIQNALNQYLSSSDAGIGIENQQNADTSMIRIVMRNYDPKNINFLNIPVKKIGARIVSLKDIVTMHHQEQEANSYFRINGANTINIVIYADELENQLKLSDNIKDKINEVRATLPTGYFLLNDFDATEIIRQELTKNALRTVFAVIILLLFVLAVSRQIRYLLLIVFSLIANLAIAVIFYYFLKTEISLYSFAGITISLGLILENSVVMIDHYRRYKNSKIFLVILATTLTTIVALLSVLFLDDQIRINLMDFSIIITINLIVSLIVALFLIPALMDKLPLSKSSERKKRKFLFIRRKTYKRFQFTLGISRFYERFVIFTLRFKKTFILLSILTFGLPLFLLPTQMEHISRFSNIYNKTLGNDWYVENVKPITDVAFGGALRMFVQGVYEKSQYRDIGETTLYVNAELPFGSSIEQMNDLVKSLEKYLLDFKEIDQFRTSITGGRNAQVTIHLKKEFEKNGFPFQLKEQIIRKSIDLGGADWTVYGIGEGFNNSVRESLGYSRIRLYGFNYDELSHWAEVVKRKLLLNLRIKEVSILSRDSWEKDKSYEFAMDLDREKLITQNGTPYGIFSSLKDYDLDESSIAYTVVDGELERIRLVPTQKQNMDIWQLQRIPNKLGKSIISLQDVSSIKKESANPDIFKENQQYNLILAYDYIGTDAMGIRIQEEIIKNIKKVLPLGYSIKGNLDFYNWGQDSTKHYLLLLFIIVVIFFICSILFESLLQPLSVIYMIPFSYIGLFFTFLFCDLNFDQGGFAALILLTGLSINGALYIINEFDSLKRKYSGRNISNRKLYMKAFNRKITPILITIFSISLGLMPFLSGGSTEVFWPALAGGTIGGLLFSLIGIVVFLPLVTLRQSKSGKMKKE